MNVLIYILLAALALLIAAVLALAALKSWASRPGKVLDEIGALALPDDVRAGLLASVHAAREAERKTLWYDVTAPLVVAVALLFTKRGANKLPAWARKWDNNISLNGDGQALLRDVQWLTAGHDISWEDFNAAVAAGERAYSYDDADYGGDAYYAKGHAPRSRWARWVWAGWRNRASGLSVALGVDISSRPVCIAGDVSASRARPGYFVLQQDGRYQYKSFRRAGPACVIRSYGAKLEYALYRPEKEFGRVPYIAIGTSFKGAS